MRCGHRIGDLWVDTGMERRCVTLHCTYMVPVPGIPDDHVHGYFDPIGGLVVTAEAAPNRTVDARGCIHGA